MQLKNLRDHTVESLWAAWDDLSPQWKTAIIDHIPYSALEGNAGINKIFSLVDNERKAGKEIYPKYHQVFRALKLCTPMSKVKVVIIGQDPYHGPGQANGLAFSVNKGQPIPPSLRNIFLELKHDIGCEIPNHGDLTGWAKQGVLLLNTSLTVEKDKPASHSNLGWDIIIRAIIKSVARHSLGILWGKHAQKFKDEFMVGATICSPHPSPFSADTGFFGSKPFSKVNNLLYPSAEEIDWSLK